MSLYKKNFFIILCTLLNTLAWGAEQSTSRYCLVMKNLLSEEPCIGIFERANGWGGGFSPRQVVLRMEGKQCNLETLLEYLQRGIDWGWPTDALTMQRCLHHFFEDPRNLKGFRFSSCSVSHGVCIFTYTEGTESPQITFIHSVLGGKRFENEPLQEEQH